ncbi:MAG: bifunctional 5,10-methylenetetrahydrofolate dehydrogenase/5,10-methenyltetrahydrofolate cyclohydrolase [Candidatus Thermoplasmatota archaeon]|nr:bifunctional 5,10-methylenetetrahydrofolate dehydrogenase/5,10-methenyltetrahydrofolate cyclohydrolase [Candidatus Thermoplasmatota archaeon]
MGDIIDGNEIAREAKELLRSQVAILGHQIRMMGLIVGDKDADMVYARMRERHAADIGVKAEITRLDVDIPIEDLLLAIEKLNRDDSVDGIIVHYPLPPHLDAKKVASVVSPEKDIDGLHPRNMGMLFGGDEAMPPATPAAVMHILESLGVDVGGKEVVVVNHSPVVGKPLAIMLLNRNATVHVCHVFTENLSRWTREADVLITAAGISGLIVPEMVKDGAIVIDVSMNRKEGKICGDVKFAEVLEKARAITPVPGGVGPVTNAMVLRNVVRAAQIRTAE